MKFCRILTVAALLAALISAFPLDAYAGDAAALVDFYDDLLQSGSAGFTTDDQVGPAHADSTIGSQNGGLPDPSGVFDAHFKIVDNANPNEPQKIVSVSGWFAGIAPNKVIRQHKAGASYVLFSKMNFYNIAPGYCKSVRALVTNETQETILGLWASGWGEKIKQADTLTGEGMLCDRSCEIAGPGCCAYNPGQPCECVDKELYDKLEVVIRANGRDWGRAYLNSGLPIAFPMTQGELLDVKVSVELPGRGTCNAYMYKAAEVQLTFDLSVRELIDIEGAKTWDHGNNSRANYPASVTFDILANGNPYRRITVTAADNWQWKIPVPKRDANDNDIVYTIREIPVPGYTTVVNGYSLTNTYDSPLIPPGGGGGGGYIPSYPPAPSTPPRGKGDGESWVWPGGNQPEQTKDPNDKDDDGSAVTITDPEQPTDEGDGGGQHEMPKTGETPLYYNILAGALIATVGILVAGSRKAKRKTHTARR